MSGRVRAAAAFAALSWAAVLPAVELSGRVEAVAAPLADASFDFLSARGKVFLEARGGDDESAFYVSASLPYEFADADAEAPALGEAYFAWASASVDLRVGRQLITWGRGDGLYISDRFCPFDYREMAAVEYDDVRVPVGALRLRFLFPSSALEAVWLPVSAYSLLPTGDNPWAVADLSGYEDAQGGASLDRGAGGVRWSAYWGGLDTSVFCSTVLQDSPSFAYGAGGLEFEYPRLYLAGADGTFGLGGATLRFEGAYLGGLRAALADYSALADAAALRFLFGVDWSSGAWSVSVQAYDSLLPGWDDSWSGSRNEATATLDLSRTFLRDTLDIGVTALCVLVERDWTGKASFALRPSAEYAFTDAVSFSAGASLFFGDEDTAYGRYADNSHCYLKAAYRF